MKVLSLAASGHAAGGQLAVTEAGHPWQASTKGATNVISGLGGAG